MKLAIALLAVAIAACNEPNKLSGTTQLTGASASSTSTSKAPPLDDADIAKAAKRLIDEDAVARGQPVEVASTHGIVTLSGHAADLEAKDRARMIAETVKGVRAVVDEVQVTPVKRADDEIAAEIRRELERDPATRTHPVTVTVKGGKVTLTGTADSSEQRKLFVDTAKNAKGVVAVDDKVELHDTSDRPDGEIAGDIDHRLRNDVWLEGDVIKPVVHDHRAFVHGIVRSPAEVSRARTDAWVAGVHDVDTLGVLVDWSEQRKQGAITDYPLRSDVQIASAVRDAFKYDARLRSMVPQVTVTSGMVTLKGLLESAKARIAAQADAKNTVGVWSVRNETSVQPGAPPTDAELDAAIMRALSEDLLVPDAKSISVQVKGGRATLSGTVHAPYDRIYAVVDATNVPGVTEVDDHITVAIPPDAIRGAIEDRLFWDARVEREHVTISVAPDGVATLRGELGTWSEVRAAVDDALAAGATSVVNLLKIAKHPEAKFRNDQGK